MRTNVELVIAPNPDDSGEWYWAVRTDGMVYAEGEAAGADEAQRMARASYGKMTSEDCGVGYARDYDR